MASTQRVRLSKKAQFMVEFLDLPKAAQIDGVNWELFQLAVLNNENRFGIDVKSRQIAWSFTAACDAVADGIINPGTAHVFVSINQDEAKEKIRYARLILDALDDPVRPSLIRDSQLELEFDNGSRMISHPCRPPRGKPRARIYLDEMAHYKEGLDRRIYRAALPATTKGDGYVRIGSSPLGARGMFWEIATEALRDYPGYSADRRFVPWWLTRAFCTDYKAASKWAPRMVTTDRVNAFGTHPLIEIFQNMFLEDFQQEYECDWIDETIAWISWALIQSNQDHNLVHFASRSVKAAENRLSRIVKAIDDELIEGMLYGGIDIGRKKHLTEFFVVGKTDAGLLPIRVMVSLHNVKFDDQLNLIRLYMKKLPFGGVFIDKNGMGAQLAENLSLEFPGIAKEADFSNQNKEEWAVEARIQAERGHTPFPPDRDLVYQIHSIKKKVTAAKHNVFDTERNEEHHADKFWAWALAVSAACLSDSSAWTFYG